MKTRILLFVCVLCSLQICGQSGRAFFSQSIGYWGKFESAVYSRSHGKSVYADEAITEMEGNNKLLGTETTITKRSGDYIVENTKIGKCKFNITTLLDEIYSHSDGYYRYYTVKEFVLLPNDNILISLIIRKTKVTGSWKLNDAVVNVDGASYLVEGGHVPIRSESTYGLAIILDCQKKYRLHKAFDIPYYISMISSTNSRLYFTTDMVVTAYNEIVGCKKILCYDFDGKSLWSHSDYPNSLNIFGMVEFIDNLYLLGSIKDDNVIRPCYQVIDAKNGNVKRSFCKTNVSNYFLGPVFGTDNQIKNIENGYTYEGISITKSGIKHRGWKYSDDDFRCVQISYIPPLDEDKQYLGQMHSDNLELYADLAIRGDKESIDYLIKHSDLVDQSASVLNKLAKAYTPNILKTYNKWNCLLCISAASLGNVSAQMELADFYLKRNEIKDAILNYERAAKANNFDAMHQLGKLYLDQTLGYRDVEKGIYWYTKAADGGHPQAMKELGTFYRFGLNVKKNESMARKYLGNYSDD